MVATGSSEDWHGSWTATALVVILCTGISISNALELLLLVLVTFKKRRGLYFWSLLVTSFSILPYSIGFLIEYLHSKHHILGDVMNNIGWAVMITGQSVVLFSRLGVILQDRRTMRAVMWMIITNGVVFYVSTTVIHYGTYTHLASFNRAAYVIEKIQMTAFCVQEFIISGLYVYEVWRFSKIALHDNARRTMWELFTINLVIIALDIALLTLEYLNLSVLEQTFKALAYSYKLKMEFAILGKLVDMAQARTHAEAALDAGELTESDGSSGHRAKSNATHISIA